MLHPDFRWKTHSTPWGMERWLYVGDVAVGHVDQLLGTCYYSYRSNLDAGAWISARTESMPDGMATVERWASAHAHQLRQLGVGLDTVGKAERLA